MAITATCEACQQQYRLGDAWAGKTASCKKCGHAMQIPSLGQTQSGAGEPPAAALGTAVSPDAAKSRRGRVCPICDSPMSGSDDTCGVCGYSADSSRHLAITPTAAVPRAASGVAKKKSESTGEEGQGASPLAVRLLILGGIALAVLAVVTAIGLGVSSFLQERARLLSRERLDLMMVELREARDASRVQNLDWDFNRVDLKAVVKDYAVKFAAELPYVPQYIQELEDKDNVLADDNRRWIITLINALPAGSDLSPLKEIPPKSFAYDMAAKKLAEMPSGR
jgi:hypothetical protein